MGVPKQEHFWNKNKHKYPFQITVKYMSEEDLDPRHAQRLVNFHFLRVPFNGEAHWGFLSQHDLDKFKYLTGMLREQAQK